MSLLPLEGPPGPLPASAPAPLPISVPAPAPAGSRRSLTRLTRRLLTLLPVLLIGTWAALDWRALYDGTARLATADPWWLLVGLFYTCLGWVSASVVRQGALPERLPSGLLVASQFAAGAANHVLPVEPRRARRHPALPSGSGHPAGPRHRLTRPVRARQADRQDARPDRFPGRPARSAAAR